MNESLESPPLSCQQDCPAIEYCENMVAFFSVKPIARDRRLGMAEWEQQADLLQRHCEGNSPEIKPARFSEDQVVIRCASPDATRLPKVARRQKRSS